MKLQEHLETLSKEELVEVAVKIAGYAGLKNETVEVDGDCATAHAGQCGVCTTPSGPFIPCT